MTKHQRTEQVETRRMPSDGDRRNDDTKEEQHNNDKWQNIQMKTNENKTPRSSRRRTTTRKLQHDVNDWLMRSMKISSQQMIN